MFNEHPVCLFAKFTNKKIIASMNSFQLTYIDTGSIYYNSIENGILKTIDINKKINKELYVARYDVVGKKEYLFPADKFEELLIEYYSQ